MDFQTYKETHFDAAIRDAREWGNVDHRAVFSNCLYFVHLFGTSPVVNGLIYITNVRQAVLSEVQRQDHYYIVATRRNRLSPVQLYAVNEFEGGAVSLRSTVVRRNEHQSIPSGYAEVEDLIAKYEHPMIVKTPEEFGHLDKFKMGEEILYKSPGSYFWDVVVYIGPLFPCSWE